MPETREDSVYLAKLAEQAERYEGTSIERDSLACRFRTGAQHLKAGAQPLKAGTQHLKAGADNFILSRHE